jgi:hypothetical protein
LPGRDLCHKLITRPEESYRPWCVVVWSRNLVNEESLAHWQLSRQKQTNVASSPARLKSSHSPPLELVYSFFISILIRVNFTLNVVYSPMQCWTL